MKYVYIDGDNIGLKIEQSFLNENEEDLLSINSKVIDAIKIISSYLLEIGHEILFAGADGVISKGENLDIGNVLELVRNINPELTFSIGIGNSLKSSYISLRYAKSYGKDIAVELSEELGFKITNGKT